MILGSLFIVVGVASNEWLLAKLFSPDGVLSLSSRLVIWVFDSSLILLGILTLTLRRRESLFRLGLVAVSAFAFLLALLSGTELYLSLTDKRWTPIVASPCHGFSRQYLHPFYYFSLPQDIQVIKRMTRDGCSIDVRGFRGALPEDKGNKKLAFLLGGSAVFGYNTDQTTISAYLNQLQSEYHFVNAGVPSWNSTQEFYRLALELIDFKPALVVVYDGFNDAAVSYHYRYRIEKNYPPGTPESYEYLEQWVADIRASRFIIVNFSNLTVPTFSRTRRLLGQVLDLGTLTRDTPASLDESTLRGMKSSSEPAARTYLRNLGLMKHVAHSYGVRILFIWQPAFFQHRHISDRSRRILTRRGDQELNNAHLRYFHQHVMEKSPGAGVEVVDFSALFDRYYDDVPVGDVFVDPVHLSPHGDQIVAKEILGLLARGELYGGGVAR